MTAAGGTISLLVGAVLLRLSLTGTFARYVRVGMGPWLALAGVAVVAIGVLTIVHALRLSATVEAGEHVHGGRGAGTPVGWLLLVPIAALVLVAPPALGTYGVDRGVLVDVRSGAPVFEPLSRRAAPVPMTLLEFGQRAFDHHGASLRGASVRLTGFVAGAEPGGFRLARYEIACCAADAAPVVVRVLGVTGDLPPNDRWVTVTGTFHPGGEQIPELAATILAEVSPPADPYE